MPKAYVPLAIMVFYPALAGCGAGETLTDEMMMDGEEPLGTTSQALVRTNRTFVRNSTVINGDNTTRREHCRVENGQFELANVAVGADVFRQNTQVLLSDGNTLRGLCTVVDEADPGDSNFYMAEQSTTADGGFEARFGSSTPRTGITVSNRWSTTAPLHVIAEPANTLADLTTSTLNKVMDFSDRARDTGARSVLYAAPHPFEAGSFDQIQYIHEWIRRRQRRLQYLRSEDRRRGRTGIPQGRRRGRQGIRGDPGGAALHEHRLLGRRDVPVQRR
ncbi:hypothetical protein [Sorangium sp. So ce1389]|uniref:hypothetical protein n=1 Tax=Sorangium sp. So ce1389 TaxID=3133336 RepID=UPI003F61E805